MKVIVGLGNPGKKYADTRHNIGFMAVDAVIGQYESSFKKSWKFSAYISEITVNYEKVLLVKPRTYMNRSGLAVQRLLSFYRVAIKDLLIVYDDVALPLGRFRFREKGSAGGHNGVISVMESVKTDEFARLRIGIGQYQDERTDLAGYVLDVFRSDEREKLPQIISCAVKGCIDWLNEPISKLMSEYNGLEI